MSAFGGAACDLHLPPTGCRKLPSFPELPRLPGKPPRWYRTWPQVLLPQPSRGVFSPRYCKPPFIRTGLAVGSISCLAHFPSDRARLWAFPAASPDTSQAWGSAPSPSPRAARGALRPNHKGFGSRSPARVPGAGRSCLTSILSRYKTRIQKSEPFHWQGLGAARSRPAAPVLIPSAVPALLSACFADTRTEDASPGQPRPGAASRGPHHSPEAAGTSAKLPVPHPSAPASLLWSGELAFNDGVCFRSSITSPGNASGTDGRTDGWDQPGCAVPADARPLSRAPCPQPAALCPVQVNRKSASMQSPPRGSYTAPPPHLPGVSQRRVWRAKRSVISTSRNSCGRSHEHFP